MRLVFWSQNAFLRHPPKIRCSKIKFGWWPDPPLPKLELSLLSNMTTTKMTASGCGGDGCERLPQVSELFGFKIEIGLDEDSFTLHTTPKKVN